MMSFDVKRMRLVATAAAIVCSLVASQGELAATCSSSVVQYTASGTFNATPISGKDGLRLAGNPFSIKVFGCEAKVPVKTGPTYDIYSPLDLIGNVKSSLLPTGTSIRAYSSIILTMPASGPDEVQLYAPVKALSNVTILIHGVLAVPPGTITSLSIAPFATTHMLPLYSSLTYSNGTNSTTLGLVGTLTASVVAAATTASPLLHTSGIEVVTSHEDGSRSVRSVEAGLVDLGASSGKVGLRFYAAGVGESRDVRVQMAGRDVPVLYAGPSGHYLGLDEVMVEVPRNMAGMGDVDVVLTVDSRTADPVRIHIQ